MGLTGLFRWSFVNGISLSSSYADFTAGDTCTAGLGKRRFDCSRTPNADGVCRTLENCLSAGCSVEQRKDMRRGKQLREELADACPRYATETTKFLVPAG